MRLNSAAVRSARAVLAAGLGAALLIGVAPAGGVTPLQTVDTARAADAVTVDPLWGDPDTAFHIAVAATFPIRQTADRYWFILHGPGGRQCDSSVTDRVGITPPKRARRVAVDLPGVRVVSKKEIVPGPWCVGTFTGRVEFRDWRPRTHRYVTKRIGTFSVEVRANG